MKSIGLILTVFLAVSCNGTAGTDMPEWRWPDKEEPAFVEPYPAIVSLGWTNVTADYSSLPEGIGIYRSPETIGGNKVVAYIAVADLSRVAWDVRSIDDPTIQGTMDPLKTPSEYYKETAAPVIVNGGYFFVEGGKRYNASVAVSGGRTYGVNLNYASIDWETVYYPTRGVFYEKDGVRATGWTYWSGGARHYLYDVPAANSWSKDPLPVPDASFPAQAVDFAPETAIGGGPVLMKGGKMENTWEAEMFYTRDDGRCRWDDLCGGSGGDGVPGMHRGPESGRRRLQLPACRRKGNHQGVRRLPAGRGLHNPFEKAMRKVLYILSAFLLFAACTPEETGYRWRDEWDQGTPGGAGDDDDTPGLPDIKGMPRYVWIDAAANFSYYANDAAYITEDCKRIAAMGFTDIILDVRPTSGDVLFASTVAPACLKCAAWVNGRYRWVERTATFDYLATFIQAGHAAGLRVNAAVNTMVGGYHSAIGDVGMLYDHPERKSWCAVDNLTAGLTNSLDDPDTGPRFLDPANAEVQEFLLTMLGELAAYEGLDGIVLDRCRYDDYNLDAGYTDAAKTAFTTYLGDQPSAWPVMPKGQEYVPSNPSTLQRNWLTFRCKVIHDFIAKAADKVHAVNKDVRFGVYVGAWFSEYYRSGVNWTSEKYDLKKNESSYRWVPTNYQKTGFADLLDFIFLGAYAGKDSIHGNTEWTMEGFAKLGAKRLCGVVPFAAGPDIGNATGFENGRQEALIPDIVSTLLSTGGGLFIFDLCHIRMFDYWNAFQTGIDAYLKTL